MLDPSPVLPPGISRVVDFAIPGPAREIRVWLLTCDQAAFDPDAFGAERIACPESIARSVRKRQAEFFFGRWAAKAALHDIGAVPSDVGIGRDREPSWPAGVAGSITHSSVFAAVAVSPRGEVNGIGIDIERIATPEDQAALRLLAIDAGECALLETLAAPMAADLLVTLAFSAKESLFKAAFGSVQRFFDFTAARVVDIQPRTMHVTLELREHLNADFPFGRRCIVAWRMIDAQTVFTSFIW
jgi:enterobactin synthetase component D